MITSGGNASGDDSNDDFDGYISDDEVMQVMGLYNRVDDDEYNSDGDEVVMNDNDVMEMTEVDDEYCDSNDFDVETEIVDGIEIVYGDEIEISATKHISLSSAAYDIPEFVGESEGRKDMTDKHQLIFLTKVVTLEIIEEMLDQTNLYTQQHFEEHPEVSHTDLA